MRLTVPDCRNGTAECSVGERESAQTKAKFSSTASSKDNLSTWINGKPLEKVDPVKYLGSTYTN